MATIAVIAVTSAGCSSHSPADTGSATIGTPGASSGNGTAAGNSTHGAKGTASTREQAVKFAECMRGNGVSGFPDPDAFGTLTIDGVVNGSSVDTSSASWKRAIGACQDLQPAGFTGKGRSPQQQQAAVRFAQCIRDHGVKDFPDPVKDQPLVDTNHIPSAATSNGLSILNAAMRKCGDFAAAAGVTSGR
jgi:hypothetical protein